MTCLFIWFIPAMQISHMMEMTPRQCLEAPQILYEELNARKCHYRRHVEYTIQWATVPPAVDMGYANWSE